MRTRSANAAKLAAKRILLKPAVFFNASFLYTQRMSLACARGALAANTRDVDPRDPSTWEFSAFSQNGEDGIVDHLCALIREPNRYFIEIGASDGLENNSSYLAFVKKYSGAMLEGDPLKSTNAERFLQPFNWGVQYINAFITRDNCARVSAAFLHMDPDFFSLDIDGIDFYVAKALLETTSLRPKIICVEYNSTFGPDRAVTITYDRAFSHLRAHPTRLYYGVSLSGWKTFFASHGYQFVTVDSNGVNAFFVDPATIDAAALFQIRPLTFRENYAQHRVFRQGWRDQFALISEMKYVEIT